ncbi:MAG: hypothetical protein ABWZ14_09005 [Acidimicrobiales bacterium]
MSKLVVGAAAVVVLAAAVVGGILFVRDDGPPTDYDARIEEDFMATCTADAEKLDFSRSEDFCRCAYDGIRADIPFDRFLAIDAALQADPTAVPGPVDRIRTACYFEIEADRTLSTVPTTTAPA